MMEPMFLKPVFQEKIWGGDRLNTVYGMLGNFSTQAWSCNGH